MTADAETNIEQINLRDDSRLIEAIAKDIEFHLSEINSPLRGYAIFTGQEAWADDLIAAYDTVERKLPMLERLLGERFDVHSWRFSPQTFEHAQKVLQNINSEFRKKFPSRPDSSQTSAEENAHIAKLHRSIVEGFCLAKAQLHELRRRNVFKVFSIPDSDLDVDLLSSKTLNSWMVHNMYRLWR